MLKRYVRRWAQMRNVENLAFFSHWLNFPIFVINCTLYYTTLCTHTSSYDVSIVNNKWQVKRFTLLIMFLVSTYTSSKSWTSKSPFHSAVVGEEWCQAKSSSTSKISDLSLFQFPFCQTFFQKTFFMYLLTMLNVIHYRMSFFLSCMLGTLLFFFYLH